MLLEIKEGTFEWALAHLRAGKSVRRKTTYGHTIYTHIAQLTAPVDIYNNSSWELYAEPKLTFKDLKPGEKFKCGTMGITYVKLPGRFDIAYHDSGDAWSAYYKDNHGEHLAEVADHQEVERA